MTPVAPAMAYATIATAPDWVLTRLDGCPECATLGNLPLLWAIGSDETTLVCTYRCNKCNHGWWTSWSIPALGIEFAP